MSQVTAARPRQTRRTITGDCARPARAPELGGCTADECFRWFELHSSFMLCVLRWPATICHAGITEGSAGLVKSDVAPQFAGQSRVALVIGYFSAVLRGVDSVTKAPTLCVRRGKHTINHRDPAAGDSKRFLGQFNRALSISD